MAQLRARKRFGQNFLTDPAFISKIIVALRVTANDHIVEVGPGYGALTELLLDSGATLDAIEIDRDLAILLQEKFAAQEKFTLHVEDALQFDLASIAAGQALRIVGNLPYNISTPLLFHFLQHSQYIHDMHFMLQSEVVDRIVATPDNKAYGRLSVMLQYYFTVERLFGVPADAFRPRPKVVSAVVRLVPRTRSEEEAVDYQSLEQLLRAAFQQRRKTIKNNLRSFFSADDLQRLAIDPSQRAENLHMAQFIRMAQALQDNL
ncbi:MAG: 16S rRNA (adenine(1518)-N(6)/adenine(1519)-N(6))-dimethyltransferase RsmA [Pseudomonadales bacterium]